MRATLIFPGITTCGWDCFGKVSNSEAVFIPHGLAYIAAYAKAKGHSIDALDLRRLSGWNEFEREIKERSPGVFGISSMSVDFGIALEAIKRIKKIDETSIVVLGGVHATVAFDDVKNIKEIDYIIKGEGEVSFSDLLEKLERKEGVERVISSVVPDIDTLPYPDRDIFNFENGEMLFPWLPHMPAPFVSIIASRGCPYQCTFCQPAERAVFGGKARIRKVESVIEELGFLRDRYNFKSLLVHDDLFTFNPGWVEGFCKAYRKNGFDQIFTCQARTDFIVRNEELIARMAESGLSCFMIGFESGSQKVLDFLKKGTTVEENFKTVEICRKYGIKIFANYMFGIPTETPEEVFYTIEFIRWARPEYPSPTFFTPYPGSDLYTYCLEKDLSLIKSYQSYARNPAEPKIKGVDYDFLDFAVKSSMEYKIDEIIEQIKNTPYPNGNLLRYEQALKDKKRQLAQLETYYKESYVKDKQLCPKVNLADKSLSHRISSKKEQKILVTGGTGFIGSVLVSRLLEKKYSVAVLTRNPNHPNATYFASKGVEIIQGYVEDQEVVKHLCDFSILFHLAIFQGTSGNKMFEVNVGGTENMLQAALNNEVERFIYASSIEAQGPGEPWRIPLSEDSPCYPVSEYGHSKLNAEEKVSEFSKRYGLITIIARIGNVYGIGGLSFIYPMTEAIIKKNPLLAFLSLFKDRFVQPIYVEDLVRVLIATIERGDRMEGTYNFTGNTSISLGEWFLVLGSFLGREALVRQTLEKQIEGANLSYIRTLHPYIDYFLSGDEPGIHRSYSDRSLRERIGNYQQFNLLKGVAYTLDWYHKNRMMDNLFQRG